MIKEVPNFVNNLSHTSGDSLSIHWAILPSYLSCFIIDNSKNTIVYFKTYSTSDFKLEVILENPLYQSKKYKFVHIAFFSEINTIIPNALIQHKKLEEYLSFEYGEINEQTIFYDELGSESMLYSVDTSIYTSFLNYAPQSIFSHISADFIKCTPFENQMVIHSLTDETIEFFVFDTDNIRLHNIYRCETERDFIYFALIICETLGLHLEHLEVQVVGQLGMQSKKIKALAQHVKNISPLANTIHYKLPKEFTDIDTLEYLPFYTL